MEEYTGTKQNGHGPHWEKMWNIIPEKQTYCFLNPHLVNSYSDYATVSLLLAELTSESEAQPISLVDSTLLSRKLSSKQKSVQV